MIILFSQRFQGILATSFPALSGEAYSGGYLESDFPSLSLEIINRDTGVLTGSLPVLWHTSAGTVTYETDDFIAELPSLTATIVGGASISAEFPSFTLAAEGNAGHAGDITDSFPSLSLVLYTGGQLEESFMRLNLEMTAVNNVLATISGTLPQLSVAIIASRASEADLDITLPMLQASMEATAGIIGSISGRLPKFSMGIVALPGGTADLEGTFRIMKFNATGGPSGPGTISADLPILEMELRSGSIDSDVLRYNWERVR